MITAEEIKNLLMKYPDGLKAEKIASKLGISVIYLKPFLYSECKDILVRDDNLIWSLKEKPKQIKKPRNKRTGKQPEKPKEHWFLSKFQNKDAAKRCSSDDFNNLADWSCGKSPSNKPIKKIKTKCGNIIECDSSSEIRMLEYLERSEVVSAVGGQALTIDYPTCFTAHNKYSPDIVILTTDNRIGIIEVKSTKAMSYHLNIEKYNALQKYCEENGFMFMMVDPDSDYMTFEELKNKSVPDSIKKIFAPMEEAISIGTIDIFHFDNKDVDRWYKQVRNDYKRSDFELLLRSLIIQKGWFNKFDRCFNFYNRPVKLDHNHNVIEYMN